MGLCTAPAVSSASARAALKLVLCCSDAATPRSLEEHALSKAVWRLHDPCVRPDPGVSARSQVRHSYRSNTSQVIREESRSMPRVRFSN